MSQASLPGLQPRDSQGRFMRVQPSEQRQALTAAVAIPEGTLRREMPRTGQPWQHQAWKLWGQVGVLHYPTTLMADQVSRMDWDVTVDGTELDKDESREVIEQVTEGLGIEEAARRLALNLEVAGEVYYVRREDRWQTVATITRKLSEILQKSDVVVRQWIADPVEPDTADSPVRAALGVAEEIRLIEALSRSQTRNRTAQRGIILYPSGGQFPEKTDFHALLQEVMNAPILDEHAVASVTPPSIKFPGDLIEKWRHFTIEAPYDEHLQERLDNATKRLALSLNIVPEILLGLADVNRWNAWIGDENTVRVHVLPLAKLTGDVFAEAISDALDRRNVVVTPDPSELLAHRSSVADAFNGLRLGAVGYDFVRRMMGADEEDAPTDEELAIIATLLRGPQAAAALPGSRTGAPEQRPVNPPPSANGNGVAAAVPSSEQGLDVLARAMVDLDLRLLGFLQGAAESVVDAGRQAIAAAREEAGDGEEIRVGDLVASDVERMARTWDRQLRSARRTLRRLGLDAAGPEWDQARERSVELLTQGIAAFLERTADRTDSEMPEVPGELLREAVAVAGGSA